MARYPGVSGGVVPPGQLAMPYRCAYLGGTFDCLHRGHLALFAATRRIADRVVVGLNSDAFAARYKRQPLMSLADRMAVIGACRLVDQVVLNIGDEDSRPAILHSGADVIVHGTDWPRADLLRQMGLTEDWLTAQGLALQLLPYTPWVSTSQLLDAYDARRTA